MAAVTGTKCESEQDGGVVNHGKHCNAFYRYEFQASSTVEPEIRGLRNMHGVDHSRRNCEIEPEITEKVLWNGNNTGSVGMHYCQGADLGDCLRKPLGETAFCTMCNLRSNISTPAKMQFYQIRYLI